VSDEARFWTAVTAGDRATVESLVRAKPGLATARRDGVSAVLVAMYYHKPEVAACLRARLESLDIFEAAALGEVDRVASLLGGNSGLANALANAVSNSKCCSRTGRG
jgi:hypothetical protein